MVRLYVCAALGNTASVREICRSVPVEDVVTGAKVAVLLDEVESGAVDRPVLGAVRVGDHAVVEDVDEPPDVPLLQHRERALDDADALLVLVGSPARLGAEDRLADL